MAGGEACRLKHPILSTINARVLNSETKSTAAHHHVVAINPRSSGNGRKQIVCIYVGVEQGEYAIDKKREMQKIHKTTHEGSIIMAPGGQPNRKQYRSVSEDLGCEDSIRD